MILRVAVVLMRGSLRVRDSRLGLPLVQHSIIYFYFCRVVMAIFKVRGDARSDHVLQQQIRSWRSREKNCLGERDECMWPWEGSPNRSQTVQHHPCEPGDKRQICGCTMHTLIPVITNEVNIASRSSVCIFDKRKFLSGGGVGRKEDEGFAIARIKHVDLRRV